MEALIQNVVGTNENWNKRPMSVYPPYFDEFADEWLGNNIQPFLEQIRESCDDFIEIYESAWAERRFSGYAYPTTSISQAIINSLLATLDDEEFMRAISQDNAWRVDTRLVIESFFTAIRPQNFENVESFHRLHKLFQERIKIIFSNDIAKKNLKYWLTYYNPNVAPLTPAQLVVANRTIQQGDNVLKVSYGQQDISELRELVESKAGTLLSIQLSTQPGKLARIVTGEEYSIGNQGQSKIYFASNLDLDPETFDVVIVPFLYDQISPEAQEVLTEALTRVLKPGGKLYYISDNVEHIYYKPEEHLLTQIFLYDDISRLKIAAEYPQDDLEELWEITDDKSRKVLMDYLVQKHFSTTSAHNVSSPFEDRNVLISRLIYIAINSELSKHNPDLGSLDLPWDMVYNRNWLQAINGGQNARTRARKMMIEKLIRHGSDQALLLLANHYLNQIKKLDNIELKATILQEMINMQIVASMITLLDNESKVYLFNFLYENFAHEITALKEVLGVYINEIRHFIENSIDENRFVTGIGSIIILDSQKTEWLLNSISVQEKQLIIQKLQRLYLVAGEYTSETSPILQALQQLSRGNVGKAASAS